MSYSSLRFIAFLSSIDRYSLGLGKLVNGRSASSTRAEPLLNKVESDLVAVRMIGG